MADADPANPTIDAREALHAAMLEWRALLTDAVMLHSEYEISTPQRRALESSSDPDDIFWLECNGMQTPEHVEAVELLALLARVDYSLWKQFVREVFDDSSDWVDLFDSRTLLRVGVHVIACDDDYDVPELSALIADSLAGPRSARYKAAGELMERVLGRRLETLSPIPVWFDCAFTYDYRGEREDDVYFEVVEETPKDTNKSGRTDVVARRDSDYMVYYDSEGNLVEDGEDSDDDDDFDGPADLDRLPRLVGKVYKALARQPTTDQPSAMRITQFTLRPSDTYSERQFLSADTRVLARLNALRGLGIRVTDLPTVCFDDRSNKSHSKTLERVQSLLDATSDQISHILGVDRCAIVHLGARLCMDLSKSLELAPRVFSAVQASTSLRSVMVDFKNMARKNPRDRVKAAYSEVERKRLVWWMTYALFARRDALETIDVSAGALRLEDVESMAELWNAPDPLVVLFGDEVEDAASSVGPVAFKSPVQLEVRGVRSAEVLLALLRLVGGDVKYLTIRGPMFESLPSPASFYEQLITACPHLHELDIPELVDLEPLVEQLRMGRCHQLQGLSLMNARIYHDVEVLQLIDALSRPQSAWAKPLRKLLLWTYACLEQGTLDAIIAMLRTNTRLRHVRLQFKVARELVDEYEVLFKSLNQTQAAEPCPVPSAIAFLSAVRATSPSRPLGALAQLDNEIVRHVLAFAATLHSRVVEVELSRAS